MKVAVLGVGLIGGSIGLAARARAGAQVAGWDPDPDACARALELGAIDARSPDIAGAVAAADIVFVAAPVGVLVATAGTALDHGGPETLVTDVGSTKRLVCEEISDPRFIGGHPLAGSEASGVGHAREGLFEGAVWYLTPGAERQSPATAPPGYDRLAALIERFGAQPVPIDADLHDRVMATVSHLPHVLANLLVAQALASLETAAAVVAGPHEADSSTQRTSPLGTGPSFRDATRVAGSNSAIWTDIYMSNRDALVAAIDELTGRLADVRAALGDGDAERLTAWNEQARAERAALLGSGS